MNDIRIPYGWCLIGCILFVLGAGWMLQIGATMVAGAFGIAAILCLSATVLGYLDGGSKFQDADRQ